MDGQSGYYMPPPPLENIIKGTLPFPNTEKDYTKLKVETYRGLAFTTKVCHRKSVLKVSSPWKDFRLTSIIQNNPKSLSRTRVSLHIKWHTLAYWKSDPHCSR